MFTAIKAIPLTIQLWQAKKTEAAAFRDLNRLGDLRGSCYLACAEAQLRVASRRVRVLRERLS